MEREDRFSQLLRSLHDIALELSTLNDSDTLFFEAIRWGLSHLGVDRLSVWLIDPTDRNWHIGTWGTDEQGNPRDERMSRIPRNPDITPEAFYEGKIPSIVRYSSPCYDHQQNIVGQSDKALAPLWDGTQIIGELAVDNMLSGRPIDQRDLDGLVLFARILANHHTLLKTKATLAQMNEGRGVLLRELKHRTRNNLAVILGLVSLETATATSAETREKLGNLRGRIESMATLYGLLDKDPEDLGLNLGDYLGMVAHQLALAHGAESRGVRLSLDLASMVVNEARASALGLALNELLTNCLKYAFLSERKGTIQVRLTLDQGMGLLEVRDDGPGMPLGYDLNSSTGLGLGLVTAMARGAGGSFSYSNNNGAVFTLLFRVA